MQCINASVYYLQVEQANFTLHTLGCPAGYVLHARSSSLVNTKYECTCSNHSENIITCGDDKEKIVIKVCPLMYISGHTFQVVLFHILFNRETSGLYTFPVNLTLIWNSMTVQWATVSAIITQLLRDTHVSITTPMLMLTCSVIVTEKVTYHAVQ